MTLCIRPNWRTPVSEQLVFKTTVFRSRSGKEQRRALRSNPRKTLSLSVLSPGDKFREFDMELFSRGKSALTISDFSVSPAILTSSASVADTSLYVTSLPAWLTSTMDVQVHFDDRCEIVTANPVIIGAFSSAFSSAFDLDVTPPIEITLTGGITSTWPAGSKIYPVIDGRLASTQVIQMFTDNLSAEQIQFAVLAGTTVIPVAPTAPSLFDSRDALIVKPNWRNRISLSHTTPIETVDYGHGIDVPFLSEEYVTSTYRYTFLALRVNDANTIRDTFLRMKGQRGEFYIPTWLSDMEPFSGVAANSTHLPVRDTDLPAAFANSTVRKAVMIETTDGEIYLRGILNIQSSTGVEITPGEDFSVGFSTGFSTYYTDTIEDSAFSNAFSSAFGGLVPGTHTIVTLDEPIVSGIHRDNIAKISWLNRVRFSTDTLVTNWVTDDLAEIQVTVTSLEHLGDA